MNTMKTLALGIAALLAAGATHRQTNTTTTYGQTGNTATVSSVPSIYDNPDTLGQGFTDINYSWVDFREDGGIDADRFIVGTSGRVPLGQSMDLGLGSIPLTTALG